jgi:hypothetical protein
MSEAIKFCRAYLARDLREFPACGRRWEETGRAPMDDEVVYVHDDFVARSGIFPEDEVLYDTIDEDWKRFCTERLRFAIPAM